MKALFKKIVSRLLHENANEVSLYKKRLNATIKCDKTHREYLHIQLRRTLSKKNSETSKKYIYLIDKLKEKVDFSNLKILCIGCRNIGEINYFRLKGAKKVVGIDIFSENKEIIVMDMHNMNFTDNTFDVIFSCHSLEHAKEPKKVVLELVRVAKNNSIFIIEVPVNYETRGADLQDFKSLQNLKEIFRPYIRQVLFEEFLAKKVQNNFAGTDIIRIIFKISKENVL